MRFRHHRLPGAISATPLYVALVARGDGRQERAQERNMPVVQRADAPPGRKLAHAVERKPEVRVHRGGRQANWSSARSRRSRLNPKSEGRNPKEIRNPKPEGLTPTTLGAPTRNSPKLRDFWRWHCRGSRRGAFKGEVNGDREIKDRPCGENEPTAARGKSVAGRDRSARQRYFFQRSWHLS